MTEAAARRIAKEAARQPRLGARALKEIFRRVVGPHEFDPRRAAKGGTSLRIDVADVDLALRAWKGEDTSAQGTSGWDQAFPMPDAPKG